MHISQINHTIRRSILLESFSSVANDLNMIIILTSDFLFSILGNIWSSLNIMTIQLKMLTVSDF